MNHGPPSFEAFDALDNSKQKKKKTQETSTEKKTKLVERDEMGGI